MDMQGVSLSTASSMDVQVVSLYTARSMEHPEPPDEETPAEKARRLWIPRAFQQTSYVSHMARKVCEDSTKADWGVWAFREYRRLLDDQMMAACRIYTEVELAGRPTDTPGKGGPGMVDNRASGRRACARTHW